MKDAEGLGQQCAQAACAEGLRSRPAACVVAGAAAGAQRGSIRMELARVRSQNHRGLQTPPRGRRMTGPRVSMILGALSLERRIFPADLTSNATED